MIVHSSLFIITPNGGAQLVVLMRIVPETGQAEDDEGISDYLRDAVSSRNSLKSNETQRNYVDVHGIYIYIYMNYTFKDITDILHLICGYLDN